MQNMSKFNTGLLMDVKRQQDANSIFSSSKKSGASGVSMRSRSVFS